MIKKIIEEKIISKCHRVATNNYDKINFNLFERTYGVMPKTIDDSIFGVNKMALSSHIRSNKSNTL